MRDWILVIVAGAVVAYAALLLVRVRRGTAATAWEMRRIAAGFTITTSAVVAGIVLTDVRAPHPPEQLGIGVIVKGIALSDARGYDPGLSVGAAVEVTDCDDEVGVRLTVAPTAEFWIDNRRRLQDSAQVKVVIPGRVHHVSVATASDSAAPLLRPLAADKKAQPEIDRTIAVVPQYEDGLTVIPITIARWGRTLHPLMVRFTAGWTDVRSRLGGCYLKLPALTGHPTVLTAQRALGNATPLSQEPGGQQSYFTVASSDRHSYYDQRFEITQGAVSVSLGDYLLERDSSSLDPNTNFSGAPAWTCRTVVPGVPGFVDQLEPGAPVGDYVGGSDPGADVAYSAVRQRELLDQQTCASYVALESPSAGTRRDVVLLGVGALFSFGIELILTGFRKPRARPASRIKVRTLMRSRRT